jgi:acyl-CoA synthetase (AMP-forming)/AMP-acid ligase II
MKALSADAPTGSPLDSQPMPRGGHVLDDVLMRQVQDRPEALALQFEGRAFSYGRLARRTERAAARLWHPWGVRTGDRVAYLGLNHVDQITLLFALARIGAVLVPLNFRLAPAEWQAVLADCTPTCLLHDAAWADAAHSLGEAADLPVHGIDTLIATHARAMRPGLRHRTTLRCWSTPLAPPGGPKARCTPRPTSWPTWRRRVRRRP